MKKILLIVLVLSMILCIVPTVPVHALCASPSEVENCHSLTEQWFGDREERGSVKGNVGSEVEQLISEYFSLREEAVAGKPVTRSCLKEIGMSSTVLENFDARTKGMNDFQLSANVEITDAEITTFTDGEHYILHTGGMITAYVYEWTFFDYDDLRDSEETTDVSGYGVYHKICIKKQEGKHKILSDEYDESDFSGICTIGEATRAELIEMNYRPDEKGVSFEDVSMIETEAETDKSTTRSEFYSSYDTNAVVEYADQYVYHQASGNNIYAGYYNSAYYNFNPLGGDCANYTSQCIYAGGMPQVAGTVYGTDGWFYKTSTNRSATWTGAMQLRNWMANNRGNMIPASDTTVYKGSPVFYNDAHATICVGKNSAGTPIINSHNYDRYHVVWDYWGADTSYTTVQLTAANDTGGNSSAEKYIIDNRYPTPFKANTLLWWNTDNGKTPVYLSVEGTVSGYIYNGYSDQDDDCTIQEVYTNGWCKVTVPGINGDRYCKLSVFVNIIDEYNPWHVTAPSRIDCYRRWDYGSPRGYIDAGDHVCIISETDSMFQVVYPTSTINYCRWVERCALTHAYEENVTVATCIGQGYTTYICSVCGYSYKDAYIDAKGHSYDYVNEGDAHNVTCGVCGVTYFEAHSYEEGACVCGDVESTAPVVDESIVINHTLNLASDISVSYAVKAQLLETYEAYYLEVKIPVYEGNERTGDETVQIDPVISGSYIYFTLTGVTAVQMNDELTATLYMTKSGKNYASKEDLYSIAIYACNQLNKSSAPPSLKKLCADLLCYGAATQRYKGYRTDALVTENLSAAHETYMSNTDAVTFGNTNIVYSDISNPLITWVGKSLDLDSKVIVRFVFDAAAYTGNISDLTLKLVYEDIDGIYQEAIVKNPTVYNAARRQYAFDFDGLMAAELRTAISVAVYARDMQVSQTLRYSPDTYGNNKTGALLAVCKSLFAYSDSARKFFIKGGAT